MKVMSASAFVAVACCLSACATASPTAETTGAATMTASPAPPPATATNAPTPSPTATSTPPPISVDSVVNIADAFPIGVGPAADATWLPDDTIAITSSAGVSIYDGKTFKLMRVAQPAGHSSLTDSAVSHDGKRAASLVDNKVIEIWDLQTGEVLNRIETECDSPREQWQSNRLAFTHDDSRLVGCNKRGLTIWNLRDSGEQVHLPPGNAPIRLRLTVDDTYLASIGSGSVRIWNITTQKEEHWFNWVTAATLSHNGALLAYATRDRHVMVYDVAQDKSIAGIQSPDDINGVAFSPDDKTVVMTGNYYTGSKFADVATGKITSSLEHASGPIVSYGPDGTRLLMGWSSGLQLYTRASYSGSPFREFGGTQPFDSYEQVEFNPGGRYVAVQRPFGFLLIWDYLNQERAMPDSMAYGGGATFSPDGFSLITRAWKDNWWGGLQLWSLGGPGRSSVFSDFLEPKNGDRSLPPVFCPNSRCVAAGVGGREVKIWDSPRGTVVATAVEPGLSDYAFDPQGAMLATSAGQRIDLWDATTWKKTHELSGGANVAALAFGPDHLLAAATGAGVRVWQADSRSMLADFRDVHKAVQVAVSPKGDVVAAVGSRADGQPAVFVWNLADKKLLFTLAAEKPRPTTGWRSINGVKSLSQAFVLSPDGSLIMTYGFSDYIQCWSAASGKLLKTIDWIKPLTYFMEKSMGFSPDGRLFAVAAQDGTIKVLGIAP